MVAQYNFLLYFYVMRYRVAHAFTGSHMKKFAEIHSSEHPGQKFAPRHGYPDQGEGRFSKALPYKQWFLFASAQRIANNYFEQLPMMILFTILAGICSNETAFITALVYIGGRFLYSFGYMRSPGLRVPGAAVQDGALLFQFYLAVNGLVKHWPQ